jgi:hypothetical protein
MARRRTYASLGEVLFFIVLSLINSLPPPASATLSNSFCTDLDNVPIPGFPPEPNINGYVLNHFCVVFYNATSFGLQLSGSIISKNVIIPIGDTTCVGEYFFAQGQKITFSEDLAQPVCISPTGAAYSFCWACPRFAGTYVPFFDSIAAPMQLTIAPGDSQEQPFLWGGLTYSMNLQCNTTTCGSASNIFPPAPLPQNASFTVRRDYLHSLSSSSSSTTTLYCCKRNSNNDKCIHWSYSCDANDRE